MVIRDGHLRVPLRTRAPLILKRLAGGVVVLLLLPASGAAQSAPVEGVPAPTPSDSGREGVPYTPVMTRQRLDWFVKESVGPEYLAVGVLSSAVNTPRMILRSNGGTWSGFGKRFAVREGELRSVMPSKAAREACGEKTRVTCGLQVSHSEIASGTHSSKLSLRNARTDTSPRLRPGMRV
jgi:hypothetical protein